MALSDEELAALAHVRWRIANGQPLVDRDDYAALEQILALAGEPVPEPEPGSIWFDPRYRETYVCDTRSTAYPWTKTDNSCHAWSEFQPKVQRRLVRLVREDGVDCGAE